jgi:Lon protease-like protein
MFEIPLHIFEARYRALFNTLLHGNEGLDDAMIDETSPFLCEPICRQTRVLRMDGCATADGP